MQEINTEQEKSALYFLRLILQNWKLLFSTYLLVGVTTVIVLLLLPQWYRSSATIVILEENTSPLSGVLNNISSFGLGIGGGTSVDTYMQYVRTKKMYDRLITQFNLQEEYESVTKEDTYDFISEYLSVSDNENTTFTISYAYKEDPEKSAEIVNFIFNELDKIALEVEKAQASNFKKYIEQYYFQTNRKLTDYEDSLIVFQTKTGIIDLESQVEATVLAIAELEKQKIALQIERNVKAQTINNNSRLKEIDTRINSLLSEINNLNTSSNKTILALDNLPESSADYLRLIRDIRITTQVTEFLRLQYEQALLDEQKINSDLYLLDPPQPPEKRFKPARTKSLVIVMFFTFVISLILLRIYDYLVNNKQRLAQMMN
ncbi:MAG: hypothetical protein JJ895_03505 [Balneolaceae bacterium]|nr:hypothetical protein [Balneolaceae bacterium]